MADPLYWLIVAALLVGIWYALTRPSVTRRLATWHGAKIGLLWVATAVLSVMVFAFFVSSLATPGIGEAVGILVLLLPVLWGSVLVLTWQWANARGRAGEYR